jgi:hypothetical protein
MTTTYSEKLRDPRWQKKRLEILSRDEFACQICFDTKNTLHVHHRRYIKGKEPWEIDNNFLVTLCESCHEGETERMEGICDDLISVLKETFFSMSIQEIVNGFVTIPIYFDEHVTASIVEYWISDEARFKELGDRYFQYLHEKNGNKEVDPFPG